MSAPTSETFAQQLQQLRNDLIEQIRQQRGGQIGRAERLGQRGFQARDQILERGALFIGSGAELLRRAHEIVEVGDIEVNRLGLIACNITR